MSRMAAIRQAIIRSHDRENQQYEMFCHLIFGIFTIGPKFSQIVFTQLRRDLR